MKSPVPQKRKRNRHLNLGFKCFLFGMLFVQDLIASLLPASDISYFQQLIRLDYLYIGFAWFDKDLRAQLVGLSAASIITHYLQMQDYVNSTPLTRLVDQYYFTIQPWLYYSMVSAFAFWVLQQVYFYVREVQQRRADISC